MVTGAMLEARGLAWMPTLPGDRQPVLATDKVRFQGQEVAFVVAEDRYAARDALELIDVEYEALPPVVDSRRALDPDATVIRDDLPGKTDNLCFEWATGDAAATEAVFARAEVTLTQEIVFPRVHPAPLETCGAVADYDRVEDRLTLWSTTQAPHAHRTLLARFIGIEEHRIRVIAPDVGGGFGNKVPIYPGYVCAIVGSMVTGKPVKWTEDRTENLVASGFARDYVMQGEIAADRDGRILAVRSHVLADHGAFNGAATPIEVPRRLLRRLHGQLRPRGGVLLHDRGPHQQGAGRRRLRVLVPDRRGRLPRRADRRHPGRRAGHRPGRAPGRELHPARPVPLHSRTGWVYDSGNYPVAMRRGAPDRGVRRAPARAGRAPDPRRADGHRRRVLHRGGRGRPARGHGPGRAGDGRRL